MSCENEVEFCKSSIICIYSRYNPFHVPCIALGRVATSDHETSNVETGDAETSDRGSSENKLSL